MSAATAETAGAMATVFASVSERDLLVYVLQTARLNNWLVYHTFSSRHSEKGYPDVTAVRVRGGPPYVLFAELKTQRGRLRPEQEVWRARLQHAEQVSGGAVLYRLWRPSSRQEIAETLAAPAPERG